MNIIKNENKINIERLEDFVLSNANGNFFQTYRAFDFFLHVTNYQPLIYIIEIDNQIKASLLAVLIKEKGIKSYFSRRCLVWGGPIIEQGNEELVKVLLNELDSDISKKVIYAEFRNFFNTSDIKESFIERSFKYNRHLNSIVDISSIYEAKALISKSKKRQISQSIKSGAEIVEPENKTQVEEFYKLLSDLYKRKVKKPLPDYSFFESFYLRKDLGKYFLIKFQNRIIGGIMCPIYKDTIYEWFICGLDGVNPNVYPSILATWAPIEYAIDNNLKYFDFMGAGKPGMESGVRDFKSKFGGRFIENGRFIKVFKPGLFNLGTVFLKIKEKFD